MSQVPDQSAACLSFGNGEKDFYQLQGKKQFANNWKNWKREHAYVLHT